MTSKDLRNFLVSNGTANGLLIVTCLVVLWFVAFGRTADSKSVAQENVWPAGSPAPIDVLQAPGASETRHVVLFLHSKCRYCAEEMPFYRELVALARDSARSRVHIVSIEDEPALRAYAEANGLVGIHLAPKTSLNGLTATPTILLISATGRVERSWRGVLSAKQKKQLKNLL